MADGKENPFTAIFVAVIGTCAQMERDNISFRLNSGRAQYIAKGGKLGRKAGSTESPEQILEKYPAVVKLLRQGKLSMRQIAKVAECSLSTVQKVKSIL